MRYIKTCTLLTLLLCSNLFSKPLPIEYFSKDVEFTNVKISPKGTYLSVKTKKEGKDVLAIIHRKTMKLKHAIHFDASAQVGSYYWANDERVVFTKEYLKGWFDHPVSYGEILAVNADGSKQVYLMGYKGNLQTGTNIKKGQAINAWGEVLDPLPENEKSILLSVQPWNKKESHIDVYKVDIYSGKRRKVTRAPTKMARYLTDHQGNVRLATSTSDYIDYNLYTRDIEKGEWKYLEEFDGDFSEFEPIAFNDVGDAIYGTASIKGEPLALYKVNLKTGATELVSQNKRVSPSNVWINEITRSIFAVEYESGYPSYEFVDKTSVLAKRLKGLLKALPDHQVRIVSNSLDEKLQVVWAGSDRNAGDYYLYDANVNKLKYLFSKRQWLDPEKMAEVRPVSYQTRDGIQIDGYITLPENKSDKNLPLVVLPHGGPHGPRDWWRFNPETQFLANQGIAVLQVNFRGSGGYGELFESSGHQKWGADIQYDIIDGVKYLIDTGVADKNNICIMGASFGGYSALQSSILEPDMFKCTIGVVGIYDLEMMFTEGDIQETYSGTSYLKRVLGESEEQLIAFSPSKNIDKLKAPVLIVHGGEDKRAPIEQAEALINALEEHNHPFEYLELESEGHGFYKQEHRALYYKKVIDFLKKHLTI